MRKLLIILILVPVIHSIAQTPVVSGGRIIHYENFNSVFVDPRNIDVWLPDGYGPEHRYAVIYMHDGQMLFDSTHTWNHQEWCVDETLTKLLKEKRSGIALSSRSGTFLKKDTVNIFRRRSLTVSLKLPGTLSSASS